MERGIRSRFGGPSLRSKGSLGLAVAAALTLAFSVGAQGEIVILVPTDEAEAARAILSKSSDS